MLILIYLIPSPVIWILGWQFNPWNILRLIEEKRKGI